jgi:LPS-assembly protein
LGVTASVVAAIGAFAFGTFADLESANAQNNQTSRQRSQIDFPKRPGSGRPATNPLSPQAMKNSKEQMLVRANEVNYDYTNERVSAVGNVQVYYNGSALEADRLIYDQKTKRVHAEGNVRLSEPDGRVTHGEIINLSDDFRDGFVDSLRIEGPEQTRFAASRAERTAGNLTVFSSGVYTACEPCKDDPRKPPKWQVKAARIIHDQGEKMMYFEDARLEFYGVPLAWLPFFSAPDPTEKRKSGFLVPAVTSGSKYGVAVATPYYFALAPDYDFTFTPKVTTRQGPLLQGEWRQRFVNGSYTIRATGLFQLDPSAFKNEPGDKEFRGSIESAGQFRITDKWVFGWDGAVLTDKSYFQDYGLYRRTSNTNLIGSTPDYIVSQAYVEGRGARSYFDMRAMYFYGFSKLDDQRQLPVIHPIIDHDYTMNNPILGGELSVRSNLTSLSRDSAYFAPNNPTAANSGLCAITSADSAVRNNCLLRGVPGDYTRASSEATWRRSITDSFGQVFTPFVSLRADVATANISADPNVSQYMRTGETDVARLMPTVGLEYRYPFISVQSWGTQTIEPIAQLIIRPNETHIGDLPNEDSQSLIFDSSNLFKINKYAGWDRVEGGSRLNAGVKYTAQFNGGGYVNVLFGQSYQLFGQNSFAIGGATNTGLDTGLDTSRSDYVAGVAYQPNSTLSLTSRFRFDQADFTLQRLEFEAAANFDRWTTTVTYGSYAAQPLLGFLDRREGIVGTARFKVNPNWLLLGGARYDLQTDKLSETQIGVGYVDDCLILALNYITEYAYTNTQQLNHSIMLQLSLRTLGSNSVSAGTSTLNQSATGLAR